MVAIVVILAAVVATFVLDLGEKVDEDSPSASFRCTDDGKIQHLSGENIPVDELENVEPAQIDGDEMESGDAVTTDELIWQSDTDRSRILKSCEPYPDSLVGYWPLEHVGSGTAFDATNFADGTVQGSVSTTSGQVGSAASFDGGYVDTGLQPSEFGVDGSAPKTVTAWVYTENFNGGGVFEMGTETQGNEFSLRTRAMQNQWRGQFWSGADIDFTYPSKDEWVHFAVVWNGSTTTIYADGTQVASGSNSLNTIDKKSFKIGRWQNTNFDGNIDDVRLHDEALSGSEIQELYEESE